MPSVISTAPSGIPLRHIVLVIATAFTKMVMHGWAKAKAITAAETANYCRLGRFELGFMMLVGNFGTT